MLLIAHGGFSSKYKENTPLAYEKALEFHPDGLEMDVVYHDGEVYFYHPEGNRNPFGEDVDLLIEKQLTNLLSEKRKILSFKDSDIIYAYLQKTKFLYLDIKQKSLEAAINIFKRINEMPFASNQIYVGVRDLDRVAKFKEVNSKIILVSLDHDVLTYIKYIDLGVQYIRVWYPNLTDELIEKIVDYGGKIIVNHEMKVPTSISRDTGNFTEEILKELLQKNIEGVLINDIELGRRMI